MAEQTAKRDENNVPVLMGVTDDEAKEPRMLLVDPETGYLLVQIV